MIHQHHGHDYQRPAGVGNPRNPEIHLRQDARRKEPHHQVIHYLKRELARGNEQEGGDYDQNAGRMCVQAKQDGQGNERRTEESEPEEVYRRVMTISPVQGAETQRLTAPDESRQILPFFADQIRSDVNRPFIFGRNRGRPGLPVLWRSGRPGPLPGRTRGGDPQSPGDNGRAWRNPSGDRCRRDPAAASAPPG